ncbi:fatty acid desaturase family protein [Actimicrobium sp. CCI2.3]|uniref:fatty acid desaturase family protein n=1 Tax=Actimicrobium sp. CCI2.3 TaxID=3048616 RepID=UPI002AB48F49|nr:fatty acid desaturase family protein [Actimicrobium sp. CCI2.3]MDY7576226.1 fatty acid desaturase family protein [Actimicrobium sp. CCI2.3]MEB0020569.1 fatty acid desaturase family protein [Actimicrobium sp. CCI2.3]
MSSSVHPVPTRNIRLPRDLLKTLATPAPARLLLQTGLEWACIIALAWLATWSAHGAVSLLCMLLIATRQHALLALMHDYSHFQLSRKRGWLNDLVGDVFTAFPFFITIHGFRRNHLLHHKHAWTEQDPNYVASAKKRRYQFPKTRLQIWLEIVKHAIGWYTLQELKRYTVDAGMATDLPRSTVLSRFVFALLLFATVVYFDLWRPVLLYWIVPLTTFLMAILYVRDLGEHFGLPAAGFDSSRTMQVGPLERLLIAQNGVNFHADHHLFPSVPFFRLGRLHRALMTDPASRGRAVITRGYLTGLITELSTTNKPVVASEVDYVY